MTTAHPPRGRNARGSFHLGTVRQDGTDLPALAFPGFGRTVSLTVVLAMLFVGLMAIALLLDREALFRIVFLVWLVLSIPVRVASWLLEAGTERQGRRSFASWRRVGSGTLSLLFAGWLLWLVLLGPNPEGPIPPLLRLFGLGVVLVMLGFLGLGSYGLRHDIARLSLSPLGIHLGSGSEYFIPWHVVRGVRVRKSFLASHVQVDVSDRDAVREPALYRPARVLDRVLGPGRNTLSFAFNRGLADMSERAAAIEHYWEHPEERPHLGHLLSSES